MDAEVVQLPAEFAHVGRDILSSDVTAVFDRNCDNIESHQLIWLDSSHEAGFMLRQLRTVVDYVRTYDNAIDCRAYIERTSNTDTFLITSGLLGQQILPCIHDYGHIISVFIFCQNKHSHEQWSSHFPKVCRPSRLKNDHLIADVLLSVR